MAPFTKAPARVRTRRTWLLVTSFAVVVVGVVPAIKLAIAAALGQSSAVLGVLAYYAVSLGLMRGWSRWWLEQRGTLVANDAGLVLDGAVVLPRRAMREARVLVPADGRGATVRVGRPPLRLVDVEVADAHEGAALLDALALDPSASVIHYPMSLGTRRTALARTAVIVATLLATSFGVLWTTGETSLVVVTVVVWGLVVVPLSIDRLVRVSVGDDGIRLWRLLSRARFVGFDAVAGADTDGRDVLLRLRDGGTIAMHHPAGRALGPLLLGDRTDDRLVERIRARVRA